MSSYSPSRLIPISSSLLRKHSPEGTERELRKLVCSVAFELVEGDSAFRLLGPEMSYHRADPHLAPALSLFGSSMASEDILSFTQSNEDFDLCFEDSWTGYFIAARFSKRSLPRELVLIHLDDHTDMMSTLLLDSGQQLTDPASGAPFDPTSGSDWRSAIYSGAVSIGNYVTPLFYTGCTLHVRHLRDAVKPEEDYLVCRDATRYDLLPDLQFAAVRNCPCPSTAAVGTYLSGSDPTAVLKDLPRVWTIVHVDLDYFINDFNGASRGEGYIPELSLQSTALGRMELFFSELTRLKPAIDRWVIATSPGFCSGYHWKFLVSELTRRIRRFNQAAS